MRMRWYNPALGCFEWRDLPEDDDEALALLEGEPGSRPYVEVYREWRKLGATVVVSLMRTGEAARDAGEGGREGGG